MRDHVSEVELLDLVYQRCGSVLVRTRNAIRASNVQGPGNMPLQPGPRTNCLDAISPPTAALYLHFFRHAFAFLHTNM